MDLLGENNPRITQLRGYNRLYAETLINYLRTYRNKDAFVREDTIADLLTDMLAAQADGITSQDHFGKDPQAAADDILAELPNASLAQWLIELWPLFNVLWAIVFVFGMVVRLLGEDINLNLIIGWLGFPIFITVVVPLFRGLGFNRVKRRNIWRAVLAVVLIIAFYAIAFVLPDMPPLPLRTLRIAGSSVLALLVISNLGFSVLLRRLMLPWGGYWLIVAPSVLAMLNQALPLVLAAILLVVFMVVAGWLYLAQVLHVHFVYQAQSRQDTAARQ